MEVGTDLVSWDDLDRPLVVAVPGGGSEIFEVRTVAIGPEGGLDPAEIPADAASIDLGSDHSAGGDRRGDRSEPFQQTLAWGLTTF